VNGQVDDLQAYLDKAATLGGKTLVPPVEIPGQESFAWLADPDGDLIGLWNAEAS
jgi:predicted enzyme related to lactoylglutathione lyase